MNKETLITVITLSLLSFSMPVLSDSDHHHAGTAENYESVSAALATLKNALSETDTAIKADKLNVIEEIFPKIESSIAYLHDHASPKSEALTERLHTAIDQFIGIVDQISSHGVDKASSARMIKKLNGSLQLVEAYISTTTENQSRKKSNDSVHDHGGHHH